MEYKRLNDPTPDTVFGSRVYEKFSGILPAGQAAVIDSRLVVSRYSEPNGMGGRNWKSQRYGSLLYDKVNETSLGFGWVEACDETNGQLTRTLNKQEFPFAGSPELTTTSVNLTAADITAMPPNSGVGFTPGRKNLSIETAIYAEMPSQIGIGGMIRRPVQTSSTLQHFDLDLTLKSQTTTTQNLADFDAYGFVKKSTVTSLDGLKVETSNVYSHITAGGKWFLGRLSNASVTKSGLGIYSQTKSSSFTYDTATGLLKSETVEPSHPLSVTTNYTHDPFGNVTTTAITASGQTRSATTTFDSRGRFVIAEATQLGHTVVYNYNTQRALLLSTTDTGGLTTSFSYDPFGTLIRTRFPDGTETAEVTGYAGNFSVPNSVWPHNSPHKIVYFRAQQSSGAPVGKVYLDALGRELVTETTILRDGAAGGSSRYRKVYSITKYDSLGRKSAASESFAAGEIPQFTTIEYDLLSRPVKTNHSDGTWSGILSQGSATLPSIYNSVLPVTYSKTRNQSGQQLERWEDEHGHLVQSKDPSGQTTLFTYDLDGRLSNVIIGNESLLTNVYDLFGNKYQVIEANSGSSVSFFNGFGEVTDTYNARSEHTSFTYDAIGRPLTVTKPEGTFTTSFSDAVGATRGKPLSIVGSGNASGYSESFTYDSLGRPLTSSKTQFGQTFTTSTTYDALGRVSSSTDPGGLTVFNEYDANYSFSLRQKLAPGSYEGAGTILWEAGTYDSKGRALTQKLAQGVTTNSAYDVQRGDLTSLTSSWSGSNLQEKSYTWDTMGNLTARQDQVSKRLETFGYDNLNRLTSSAVSSLPGAATSTVPPPQSYTYATNGNLLTKGNSATLTYGNSSRPHAVSSAVVKGFTRTYQYENSGYVYSDGKRQYQWTSFGQLEKLTYVNAPSLQGISGGIVHPAATTVSDFFFDAAGNRARQIKERTAVNDSRKIEDTLYLGSYEREEHSTKTNNAAAKILVKTIHRHTLPGGAVYTRSAIPGTSGYSNIRLTTVLKDHLGSTDCLLIGAWNGSAFSNHTFEYQSFDAWGERRDSSSQVNYRATDANPFRTSENDYDRGYTGHEQLDDSGLIHMNGRIYDPELGRFLSPDPVVQIPEYSQNFNRYSYVLNNPLNATDPSGFSFVSKMFHKKMDFLKENWRTIVVIVAVVVITLLTFGSLSAPASAWGAAILGQTAAAAAGSAVTAAVGGAAIGAFSGALGAALAGGDLGDILRGAVVSGIQGAITAGVLHGMGEAAAQTASGFDDAVHVVGHGVVGGASNVAMGGKFQDGFISAAAGASAGYLGLYKAFSGPSGGAILGRTAIAGVVGGTASALGGGKFANGAYTAAFQHLLNAESETLAEKVKRLTNFNIENWRNKFQGIEQISRKDGEAVSRQRAWGKSYHLRFTSNFENSPEGRDLQSFLLEKYSVSPITLERYQKIDGKWVQFDGRLNRGAIPIMAREEGAWIDLAGSGGSWTNRAHFNVQLQNNLRESSAIKVVVKVGNETIFTQENPFK